MFDFELMQRSGYGLLAFGIDYRELLVFVNPQTNGALSIISLDEQNSLKLVGDKSRHNSCQQSEV